MEKLDKVSEAVERKRSEWEAGLRKLGSESGRETPENRLLEESIQSLKSAADYKDYLERFGKVRLSKEKGAQLKEKVLLATSFLETMEELKGLLQKGMHASDSAGYIQFSQVRNLIKTLRGLSFDIFTPAEAEMDFGEVCLEILTIRRPSVDLRKDYKELCF